MQIASKRLRRNDDDGFTLIELMVVLLIIAILLAVAIPTLLGARRTANARGPQVYDRNALTAEADYWASTQSFALDPGTDEPSLNWTSTGLGATAKGAPMVESAIYTESVDAGVMSASTPSGSYADGVEIVAYGRDGDCYALYQSNNPNLDFTAYQQFSASSSSPFCDVATPPTGSPASGAASDHPGTGTSTGWYSTF